MIVAIDGPSGAGKSTVAKAAAKRLGFSCLDTGAMYRAIAWKALADGVSFDDAEALGAIARDNEIEFGHVEGDPVPRRVFISGTEVTDAIRTSEIDRAVGPVAAVPAVREALVAQQQRIGRAGDYVVEGRDIGTVILPDAPVKIFLTASAESRAERRYKELAEKGQQVTMESVLHDINERDRQDMNRAIAPLRQAEDAVLVDSTNMTPEQVVDAIIAVVEDVYGKRA